jgi:hypothetical protein
MLLCFSHIYTHRHRGDTHNNQQSRQKTPSKASTKFQFIHIRLNIQKAIELAHPRMTSAYVMYTHFMTQRGTQNPSTRII